jgi:hypothetical protein
MAQLPTGNAGSQEGTPGPSPSPDSARAGPRLVASRESDEAAMRAARREVQRRIEAQGVLSREVREMLEDCWTQALARARQREGPGGSSWFTLLRVMDDLLWSVQAKLTTDDRKRLMGLLPSLIAHVQEGMVQGQWSSDRRDGFLAVLVDCHADAVKAGFKKRLTPL